MLSGIIMQLQSTANDEIWPFKQKLSANPEQQLNLPSPSTTS